jgi:hypothetical protein
MGTGAGSIAATNATSKSVSKAVAAMDNEVFQNEKMYQTTMHIVRKLMQDGVISEEEYRRIDAVFLKKYQPFFGSLFSDI